MKKGKLRDLVHLLNRAADALETPRGLTGVKRKKLIEDLRMTAEVHRSLRQAIDDLFDELPPEVH